MRKKTGIILAVLLVIAVSGSLALILFHAKPKPHSVTLSWHPPAPVSGVTAASYAVYRSTTSGGPYVRIASGVNGPTYHDGLVTSGRTYFYVVTSLDQNGKESKYSVEIKVVIP